MDVLLTLRAGCFFRCGSGVQRRVVGEVGAAWEEQENVAPPGLVQRADVRGQRGGRHCLGREHAEQQLVLPSKQLA